MSEHDDEQHPRDVPDPSDPYRHVPGQGVPQGPPLEPYPGAPQAEPREGGSLVLGFVSGVLGSLGLAGLSTLLPSGGVEPVVLAEVLGLLVVIGLMVRRQTRRLGLGVLLGIVTAPAVVLIVLAGLCVAIFGGLTGGIGG